MSPGVRSGPFTTAGLEEAIAVGRIKMAAITMKPSGRMGNDFDARD